MSRGGTTPEALPNDTHVPNLRRLCIDFKVCVFAYAVIDDVDPLAVSYLPDNRRKVLSSIVDDAMIPVRPRNFLLVGRTYSPDYNRAR
jgi:hypothetical protein